MKEEITNQKQQKNQNPQLKFSCISTMKGKMKILKKTHNFSSNYIQKRFLFYTQFPISKESRRKKKKKRRR